ncbi:VOC family protein [Ochrobactrum sp. S46]|nr:VOC family protein [Ochrobactrum sp. S45]MBK0046263.1 VOC family protein [Ochrobactrum sp. S46]
MIRKTENMNIRLSLFVEHGREREAANFYQAAFGAQEFDTYAIDGVLAGVAMRFGDLIVTVAGSNPNRENMPSHGGPFFPKQAGAVVRDEIQTDTLGRRMASAFDPFGHIWALVEPNRQTVSLAA